MIRLLQRFEGFTLAEYTLDPPVYGVREAFHNPKVGLRTKIGTEKM